MAKARIIVTLKPDLLDPAGDSIKRSLKRQEIIPALEVRLGKVIDLDLPEGLSPQESKLLLEKAASFFANPITEEAEIITSGYHD